ncbi:hypothetical protein ES319_D06G096100v1 [Gossypium barbadense]|uniref:MADS-box domain-containing protein n=2 Tax=Gossypium TaxID=3633 RepID=A0A5J5QZS9_GOSBA|nr:hypothetical protein ES319_D06G096100v1 [Gossypium barbadense]TYG64372.1 hypothetical protein ES288_D06G102800v1 [Gossypium darwinii]
MGRRKLKIQRLEDMKARQAKYSKRKKGILKKAKELSILCDVEVVLLLSSPSGKPTLFVGQDPNGLYCILQKVSNMPFVEREERRAYTLEMLKKFYVNWESKFDPLSLPRNNNVDTLKLYEDQLQELKDKLTKKSKILRDWKYPENVEDLNQIKFMEDHLIVSLNGLRNRKNQLAMEQQSKERYLEGTENLEI